MDGLTPDARAAALLLEEKENLARAVTAAMYEEDPSLLERFGATGRERCLEDVRFTVEHLVPAVDLGDPEMFAKYVRWLDGLLRARKVETRHVRRSLELVEEAVRATFPVEEAGVVADFLRAGTDVLAEGSTV